MLNSSNTVSIPIHSDKNESHNLEFKLVIGLGLNSSSFHTIVIPQLKVRKFSQFMTLSVEERGRHVADADSALVARTDQLVDLERFKAWVKA